jgi:hypothetical protein
MPLRHDVGDRDQLGLAELTQRCRVRGCNRSATDDAESNRAQAFSLIQESHILRAAGLVARGVAGARIATCAKSCLGRFFSHGKDGLIV